MEAYQIMPAKSTLMLTTHIFSVMYLVCQVLNSWFLSKKTLETLKMCQVSPYGEGPRFCNVVYQSWNLYRGYCFFSSIHLFLMLLFKIKGKKLLALHRYIRMCRVSVPGYSSSFPQRFLKGNVVEFSKWPWTDGKNSNNSKPPPLIFSHQYHCYLWVKSTCACSLSVCT